MPTCLANECTNMLWWSLPFQITNCAWHPLVLKCDQCASMFGRSKVTLDNEHCTDLSLDQSPFLKLYIYIFVGSVKQSIWTLGPIWPQTFSSKKYHYCLLFLAGSWKGKHVAYCLDILKTWSLTDTPCLIGGHTWTDTYSGHQSLHRFVDLFTRLYYIL